MTRVPLLALASYWLIACLVSWPFMFMFTKFPDAWQAIPLPPFLKASLFMWGPGIAALICYRVFRHKVRRETTLAGHSRLASLIALLVPLLLAAVVIFAVAGIQQLGFFLALVAPLSIFNTLGEELGWRGYLQDALREQRPFVSYLIVGVLWELWHLPMRLPIWDSSPLIAMALAAGTLVIAQLAGYLVRATSAVFLGVSIHLLVNMALTGEMQQLFGLDRALPMIIAGTSLVVVVATVMFNTQRIRAIGNGRVTSHS